MGAWQVLPTIRPHNDWLRWPPNRGTYPQVWPHPVRLRPMERGGRGASVITGALGARLQWGGGTPILAAWGTGPEHSRGGDQLQRPLVPCFGFSGLAVSP